LVFWTLKISTQITDIVSVALKEGETMKNILAFFLALFALVATPAMACEFTGQNKNTVGAVISDASVTSVSVAQLAKAFWGDPTKPWPIRSVYERVGCTEAEVTAKIIALNGGDSSALLARSAPFHYPTPLPKAAPAQPAPAASAAPVAQASAAPAPVATAPAAAPKPVTSQVIYQKVELSPAEKAEIAALSANRKQVQDQINAINAKQAPTEADLTALTALQTAKQEIDLKLKGFEDKLNAISGRVNNQAIEVADIRNWIYGLVIGLVLLALGVILLWWKKPSRKALAKTNHNVAELSNRVTANEERIESVGQQSGAVDIRFGVGQLEDLNALPEGETLPVEIIVDGEKKFEIRFKRVTNELFVADEPKSRFRNHDPQVTIANPYKFVCRNYGKGEFTGFLLTSVAAAA